MYTREARNQSVRTDYFADLSTLTKSIEELIRINNVLNSESEKPWTYITPPDCKDLQDHEKISVLKRYCQKLYTQARAKYNEIVELINTTGANIEEGKIFLNHLKNFFLIEHAINARLQFKKLVNFIKDANDIDAIKEFLNQFSEFFLTDLISPINDAESIYEIKKFLYEYDKAFSRELPTVREVDQELYFHLSQIPKTAYFVKKLRMLPLDCLLVQPEQIQEFALNTDRLLRKLATNKNNVHKVTKIIQITSEYPLPSLSELYIYKQFTSWISKEKNVAALKRGGNIDLYVRMAFEFLRGVYEDFLPNPTVSRENPIIQVFNARNLTFSTKCAVIKELIKRNHHLVNQLNEAGYTPLEYLLSSENTYGLQKQGNILDLVEILIQSNAYLGLTNGHSPLHFVANSHLDEAAAIYEFLVDHGADPDLEGDVMIHHAERTTIKCAPIDLLRVKVGGHEHKLKGGVDSDSKRELKPLDIMSARSVSPLSGIEELKPESNSDGSPCNSPTFKRSSGKYSFFNSQQPRSKHSATQDSSSERRLSPMSI